MADLADDDRLLDALAVALRPDASAEPTLVELAALQRVVAEVQSGSGSTAHPGHRLRRWAAGVVVGGVVLSGGTAYATSPVAPRPVRSAAFALKLPVESPELTDAKDALDDLEEALREGRRDEVTAEVEDVREELADLAPDARRALDARASSLLSAAEALLARPVAERDGAGADDGDGDEVEAPELDDSSGPGSGGDDDEGSSGSGSGGDDVDAEDLDDPGSGSSGSGSDGSGSGDDVDAEDLDDAGRGGSSGSGSGGSGSSGSGSGSGD